MLFNFDASPVCVPNKCIMSETAADGAAVLGEEWKTEWISEAERWRFILLFCVFCLSTQSRVKYVSASPVQKNQEIIHHHRNSSHCVDLHCYRIINGNFSKGGQIKKSYKDLHVCSCCRPCWFSDTAASQTVQWYQKANNPVKCIV